MARLELSPCFVVLRVWAPSVTQLVCIEAGEEPGGRARSAQRLGVRSQVKPCKARLASRYLA